MLGPFSLKKTTIPVSDLKEDDRFYIGGLMYKIDRDPLTDVMGFVHINMHPVYVDFLPEITTMTLHGRNLIEIYNQP